MSKYDAKQKMGRKAQQQYAKPGSMFPANLCFISVHGDQKCLELRLGVPQLRHRDLSSQNVLMSTLLLLPKLIPIYNVSRSW